MQVHQNSLANLKAPWPKGYVPNPGGKPVHARNAITNSFLKRLAKDFEEHGEQAICELREKDPGAYLRIVASLVPKDMSLNISGSALDKLTDEQLINLAGHLSNPGIIEGSSIELGEEVSQE